MAGRHRFAGEDKTVRPLLAAVVPVVAVCGMTVAILLGSTGSATSTPRVEVPRFGTSEAAGPTSVTALPVALPVGTSALRDVSGAGASAVARLDAGRAEADAERERSAAAAREAAAQEAAVPEPDAGERPAPQEPAAAPRPVVPRLTAPERSREQQPRPSTRSPQPQVADEPDPTPSAPARPRGLLGSLLGSGD